MRTCDVCSKSTQGDWQQLIEYNWSEGTTIVVCSTCQDERLTPRYGGLAVENVVTEADRIAGTLFIEPELR